MSDETSGRTDGGVSKEVPEELDQFVDTVTDDAIETGVSDQDAGGGASEEDSDELFGDDMDPRVERFGKIAGVLVIPVLVVSLFVGPWRVFDISLGAGTIPIVMRGAENSLVLVAPIIVIAGIGVAAGAVYRATTDDRAEEYRSDIASKIIEVQVIVAALAYLLVLLAAAGHGILDGEVAGSIVLVIIGLIGLVFFSFFEFLAAMVVIGIPAIVGVIVGDYLGLLWRKSQT